METTPDGIRLIILTPRESSFVPHPYPHNGRQSFSPRNRLLSPIQAGFYRYSSGRWLWDEEAQLRSRYKRFNVPVLKNVAARSTGAQTCVSMTKFAGRGFNKLFRLLMDNGVVVIARIPNPNARPPFKTIASEVATMDFARTILGIAVPRVLSSSGEVDNPVQSEYILMQEAVETQLGEIWAQLELQRTLGIVEQVVAIERKFLSISFTLYGNLYSKKDASLGCKPAEIVGNILQSLKEEVRDRFVIRPVVSRDFCDSERLSMNIDRGPCSHAAPKPQESLFATCQTQNLPDAYVAVYKKFQDVADYIIPEKREHVSPLFLQARYPRLVDFNGKVMLRLPEYYETLDDEDEKARIRNPVLHEILYVPRGRTRRDVVELSNNTWCGNIIPFRERLIRIEHHWDEIKREIPCPIHFADEELQTHARDAESWNEDADFWASLEGSVHRDGWTSNENYERAIDLFARLRAQGMQNLDGEERSKFEKQTRWAARRIG
ncbi:phosphotransferase family protein [Lineolata rhizophorae]|uniref:Altered inheritance of mitochondria protein 9, mitochondrial n=1 Tax=Lineolata rhizophorae TaxID=578093 RepID=A0A6A6P8X7_9PEZI|nr:phosphotransferase family protein [Lineolata rhizophorae]